MIKTMLKIDGMACGMCEAHINDCIRQNFEIRKIKTSHAKGESEILSDTVLDEEKLSKIIANTGYKLKSVKSELFVKKGFFSR
ncbi:MAG: heavy metal-associated domain-containing protein [Oscillospiraceae bacterium]|nr:heavy metal-associated domain-containing protein [Oscillospiraceae bacterium]